MAETTTTTTETLPRGPSEEESDAAKLKSALEDRKILRRHARKLEGEVSEVKKQLEVKTKEFAAIKTQLESALEDRKLLRRHARQRDEAGSEAAREAARLKTENEQLRNEALRQSERADSLDAELREDREALEALKVARDLSDKAAAEEKAKRIEKEELAERERRETLRESQVVVAALKEEVSRLRSAVSEAETKALNEKTRGDAARRAATAAAAAAKMADEALNARAQAARCEAEAQFASEIRQRDDFIGDMHARQTKEIEELKKKAAATIAAEQKDADLRVEKEKLRTDSVVAKYVAHFALSVDDLCAAANASFLALSDSFVALVMHADEIQQKNPSASASKKKKQQIVSSKETTNVKKQPKSTHEWRTEKIRVTLLRKEIGLECDAFGRVTRVRGEALKAGVAFGDRVVTLATAPVDDFLNFAKILETTARPVVLDLERAILVEKDDDKRADAADVVNDEQQAWRPVKTDQPCPSFGVDSPEVTHLLREWTKDPKKLQYVKLWLAVAADTDGTNATAPKAFPRGLQLPALRHELLHGFLALVIPILKRARGDRAVDIKIRTSLTTAPSPANSTASGGYYQKKTSSELKDEENTQEEPEIIQRWDLAIKIDIPSPVSDPPPPRSTSKDSKPPTPKANTPKNDGKPPRRGIFSRSSTKKNLNVPKDEALVAPSESPEEKARRDKLNAQRREAMEEKLAKMRGPASS